MKAVYPIAVFSALLIAGACSTKSTSTDDDDDGTTTGTTTGTATGGTCTADIAGIGGASEECAACTATSCCSDAETFLSSPSLDLSGFLEGLHVLGGCAACARGGRFRG